MTTMPDSLLLALLALVGLAVWSWHVRRHPWVPCGKCRGSGNARHLSLSPFGHCGRCGGKGKRLRFAAKVRGYDLDAGSKKR